MWKHVSFVKHTSFKGCSTFQRFCSNWLAISSIHTSWTFHTAISFCQTSRLVSSFELFYLPLLYATTMEKPQTSRPDNWIRHVSYTTQPSERDQNILRKKSNGIEWYHFKQGLVSWNNRFLTTMDTFLWLINLQHTKKDDSSSLHYVIGLQSKMLT